MRDTDSVFGRLRMRARKEEHEQHFYVRMIMQHFRPGMRWLDAGCGHSLIPEWLKGGARIEQKFLSEAEMIVGADVDIPSLVAPSPIRRVACRLEQLGFQDRTFDLITCNMVVEHLAAPAKVFSEFSRVLRPGGIVIMLTPNIYHWANIVSMLTPFSFHRLALKRLWNQEPEDVFPTLYRCNTRNRMQTFLRTAGFSNIDVHMVPGRQRLVEFGPLFYPEYLWYRLSARWDNLREILCAIAEKSSLVAGNAELRPAPGEFGI
jgi:ubiquinone/menaquinone biosynthesis C-methylase UbiE